MVDHCSYQGSSAYETSTRLEVKVKKPSYDEVLEWMRTMDGRATCYDFWSRGNYTRRLIHHRAEGISPLQVRVSYVDEMRWAYRRLALLGLPIDFIYCGNQCEIQKVMHLSPAEDYFHYDAGWGYLVVASEPMPFRGREWLWCIGNGYMLPESALDWLVEETADAFLEGQISIAPAELIGIDPAGPATSMGPLTSLTRSISLAPVQRLAQALMDLEIPFLDSMPSAHFSVFLKDHRGDLEAFQRAFQKLVSNRSSSESEVLNHIEEIKHEVAELTQAERSKSFRRRATLLQGVLRTAPASLVVAQDATNIAGWAAATGAAGATLLDLWKQAQENVPANPFSILWKLGMDEPAKVRQKPRMEASKVSPLAAEQFESHAPHHWLCPPTSGVDFVFAKQKVEQQ